jgi:pimeloyl-ACP methyl ester carboxylesterase
MVDTARSADGTKIAYERTGDGPVLILAGGALDNRHSADALVPLLAEKFSVVTFDRRGRGDSTDTSPYAPAREVEDLKALIDAVGGSAMIFGHSSGAVLALEAAADGAAITWLAVNEPPYLTGNAETGSATLREIEAALDAGDRGTAVEIFIRGTGAPFDPAMKTQPWFAGLEAVAHKLPYDLALVGDSSVPVDRLAKYHRPNTRPLRRRQSRVGCSVDRRSHRRHPGCHPESARGPDTRGRPCGASASPYRLLRLSGVRPFSDMKPRGANPCKLIELRARASRAPRPSPVADEPRRRRQWGVSAAGGA